MNKTEYRQSHMNTGIQVKIEYSFVPGHQTKIAKVFINYGFG